MKCALIPARGGSRRIPRKNVKDFCGKPMLAWSIAAAQESGCFDRIVVSTDDAEIAAVAKQYGADVPFVRPSQLSNDHTGITAVVRHAIEWLNDQGDAPVHVCCLLATAPLLAAADIARGLEVLITSNADYAFSVTSYPFPIQRAIRVNEQGRVEMFNPAYFPVRSQDLEASYHDAGQFYWGVAAAWLNETMLFGPQAAAVHLPRYRVQDIDTEEDWQRAEYVFRAIHMENFCH